MGQKPVVAAPLAGGVKAYARHRKALGLTGGTPAAVRKADDRGDIVWSSPGVIDFVATDARWGSDVVQEAWGELEGGTTAAVPPPPTEPVRRPASTPASSPPQPPMVVPRQQDATAVRLKGARADREEVEALRKLRALQVEEGELMRADTGTALMLEVVGRVCDRMDAVPDSVTEDLVAMVTEWLGRAAKGETVEVDTVAIHGIITEAVRSAREGAAAAVEALRETVLAEQEPAW